MINAATAPNITIAKAMHITKVIGLSGDSVHVFPGSVSVSPGTLVALSSGVGVGCVLD